MDISILEYGLGLENDAITSILLLNSYVFFSNDTISFSSSPVAIVGTHGV